MTADADKFVLNNATVLRGYLAHIQSMARTAAALYFERANHPEFKGPAPLVPTELQEHWAQLSKDLVIVLGPGATLKPYGQLAAADSFASEEQLLGRDPFRITMKALKLLADKARRRHPEVKLLASWKIEDHEPPEKDDNDI